jgi:hypothetical protein
MVAVPEGALFHAVIRAEADGMDGKIFHVEIIDSFRQYKLGPPMDKIQQIVKIVTKRIVI